MDCFHLKKNRSIRFENDDEKTKNDRFLMKIVLKNGRFQQQSFLKSFVNDR